MLRCFSLPHSRIFSGRGIYATRVVDALGLPIILRRKSTSRSSVAPCQPCPNRGATLVNRDASLRVSRSIEVHTETRFNADQSSLHVASYALCCLLDFTAALASGSLPVHAPDVMESLYHTARDQSELRFLSDGDLNTLVSFYGSLSALPVSDAEHWTTSSTFRLHPAISAYGRGAHWPFVLILVSDMKECGRVVTVQSRFWQMHADLARVRELSGHQHTAEHALDVDRFMLHARLSYHRIRNMTSDPNVHLPWLSTLLSLGTTSSLNEALLDCAHLIRCASDIDEKLQIIIWRILSTGGTVASKKTRNVFCDALRQRFIWKPQCQVPRVIQASPSTEQEVDQPASVEDLLNLNTLHTHLATTLLSDSKLVPNGARYLHKWAMHEVRGALDSDRSSLWKRLCLSALICSLPAGTTEHTPLPPIQVTGELQTWNFMSALLLLQAVCRSEGDTQLLYGGAQILRALWQAWLGLGVSRPRRGTPLMVERVLWIAFIYTAGIVKDSGLLSEICNIEPFKSRLVPFGAISSAFPVSVCEAVSVTIASATAACSVRSWNSVLCHLENAQVWHEESRLRKIVVDVFIHEWAISGRETEVAFKLYQTATSFELVSSNSIRTVARACLRNGLTREAFICLDDPAFQDEPMTDFVDLLLRLLRARKVRHLPKDMANVLGHTMKDMTNLPVKLVHARSWEWAVSIVGRSECAPLAVDVALAGARHYPQLGSRRWWTTFVHQLCNMRLFRVGLRLVKDMPASHNARRAMCLALVRRLGLASAHRLAWQAYRSLSPGRVPSSIKLLKIVDFRGRAPRSQDSLAILPFLFPSRRRQFGHDSAKTYSLALHLLARAKRARAVERTYLRSKDSNPTLKTHVANAFLSATLVSSRKRNGRELRRLVKLLNRLIKEDGLVPDRVTLNIILKAILRWPLPADARKLRVLFGRVIESGLPPPRPDLEAIAAQATTKTIAPSEVLDGQLAAQPRPLLLGLPSPGGPVEFERHVRPLYRMFLKAFRSREDWNAAWAVLRILAKARDKIE